MYVWLKAFHVIAIIAWMAGMLYLPRLFVYHCEAEPGSKQSETFKVMERRLLHAIITPAMVGSWVLGLWLAWAGGFYAAGWLHAKLVLVIALSALHGFFVRYVREFAADGNRHSQRFYRVLNEIPTILMIGSGTLAVVKPFGGRGQPPPPDGIASSRRHLPPSTCRCRHLRCEPSLPILGSPPRTQANALSTGPSAGAGRCIGAPNASPKTCDSPSVSIGSFFNHRSPP